MELTEKITEKHKQRVKDAEVELEKAKKRLNGAFDNYLLVTKVIRNIKNLRDMNDLDVRISNPPRALISDHDPRGLEFYARPGDIIHYEISERLNHLRSLLVMKHDAIYNIKYGGEMGAMTGRSLKEGHSPNEFNDGVWDVLNDWKKQYLNRMMSEDLHNSIMNDNFYSLYSKLVSESSE